MPLRKHNQALENIYSRYNDRAFVHPDPLEFVYRYSAPADREVVGLIASSLAYGRVAQILRSVDSVLGRLTPSPARFVRGARPGELDSLFDGFVHRIWTGRDLAGLLAGIGGVLRRHGSLGACFAARDDGVASVAGALRCFVGEISDEAGRDCGSLLPDPARGSACKRLHLYLRWMVRRDSVDPGVWEGVSPSRLLVPLDTHMHRIGLSLGATARKSADAKAAEQITDAFRRICPEDPVRYDFSLTRLGIHPEGDLDRFLRECAAGGN
jgi:uncharacterized protein (TIGR02757 family)